MRAITEFPRLNATPDVTVRIRNAVVTVPIPQSSIVAVVPIPTDDKDGDCTHYPFVCIFIYQGGGFPLNNPSLKEVYSKGDPRRHRS